MSQTSSAKTLHVSPGRLESANKLKLLLVGLVLAVGARPCFSDETDTFVRQGLAAQAEGKWEEAESAFRSGLEAAEKGSGKLPYATAYQAFASFLHDRGRYAEAFAAYEKALSGIAVVHGEKSMRYASCLNNIGQCLCDQGRYQEAHQKLDLSLKMIRDQQLGPTPDEVLSLNAMAVLYRREGKYVEAVRHYSDALELVKKLPDVDLPFVITATLNLGIALTEQGELAKAEACLKGCFDLLDKNFQTATLQHAAFFYATAKLKLKQKEMKEARRCAEESVQLCKQIVGEKHPRTASSLEVLADIRLIEGEFAEADGLLSTVLSIRKAALGPKHPQVADVYARKAKVALAMKKTAAASQAYKLAYEILHSAFGKAIPQTHKWVREYAEFLRANGQNNDAERVNASIANE